MALQPRRIFIDVQNRTFISSPNSNLPSIAPVWIEEDVESVELYALRTVNNGYQFVDLSSSTVKFAVGSTSPAAFQTAWTAMPTEVIITNTEVQEGGTFGGTVDEEQKLTWSGATAVQGTYTLSFPYRDITYSISSGSAFFTCQNHGLYDGRIVTLNSVDYSVINSGQNSFSLATIGSTVAITAGSTTTGTISIPTITTPPIAYNASTAQVQQAVVDAGFAINGIPQVQVSGENGKELSIRFTGRSGRRSYSPIIVSNSSLKGAPGVTANVSYNTTEIAALIDAGTTNVTMEIEISEGAVRQTFRQDATLSAHLINSTSPNPIPTITATSFGLQSANGTVFTISVTNSGELVVAA